MRSHGPSIAIALLVLLSGPAAPGQQPAPRTSSRGVARLVDGSQVNGFLVTGGDDLRFETEPDGRVIPPSEINWLELEGLPTAPGEPPPFRLELGQGQVISGDLLSVDGRSIRFVPGHASGTPESLEVSREAAGALAQRPGQALALTENFDGLDPDRWELRSLPIVFDPSDRPGDRALKIPAGGNGVVTHLREPIGSGRLDLDYLQQTARVRGQRASVELVFDGPDGPEVVQVLLGWSEAAPAVLSRGGPALVVQQIVPQPGWRQLSIRFRPDRTLVAIDGDELARGDGPSGPLQEIRLVTDSIRGADEAPDLALVVDRLRLIRFVEPTGTDEVDPDQDVLDLVSGDQVWGRLESADPSGPRLEVDGRLVPFAWSDVSRIEFRRVPSVSKPVEGRFLRVDWLPPGASGDDRDRLEGAIASSPPGLLNLETPHAGRVSIPLDRVRRLENLGRTRSIVLDSHARHLGDQMMPELDPPQPDGDRLVREFTVDSPPDRPARLAFDVVDVEGDYNGGRFADEVRAGHLVTQVVLNDRPIGTLNQHVTTSNKSPVRIYLPIPADTLLPGKNVLELRQTGRPDAPEYRDDLGVLRLALEWPEG